MKSTFRQVKDRGKMVFKIFRSIDTCFGNGIGMNNEETYIIYI